MEWKEKLKSDPVERSIKNNLHPKVAAQVMISSDVDDTSEVAKVSMVYKGERFESKINYGSKFCPVTKQPMRPSLVIERSSNHFKECIKDVDAKLEAEQAKLEEQETEVYNVSENESTSTETPLNAPETPENKELTPQQKAVITRKANAAKKANK